jgi:chaperonin GroEL
MQTPHERPTVLPGGRTRASLYHGIAILTRLLAQTFGPLGGAVLATRDDGGIERLDDGATIARRLLELPDPGANAGAMLLRHGVWRVHERASDGGVTAALVTQAILAHIQPLLAAGYPPRDLRQGLEAATATALQTLAAQTQPVASQSDLYAVLHTAIGDERLAALLAEVFDQLGPDAALSVADYVAPYLACDYIRGARWSTRPLLPQFHHLLHAEQATHAACAVALYAGDLVTAGDVAPLLASLLAVGQQRLLLVAHDLRGDALATLRANQERGGIAVIAVALTSGGDQRRDDFADLAALTGAALRSAEKGDTPAALAGAALGFARRVVATAETLTLDGDHGGAAAWVAARTVQTRLAALHAHERAPRRELEARLGRLIGQSAVLKLGAANKLERDLLKRRAQQGVEIARGALRSGSVLGGGAAYMQAAAAVAALPLPPPQAAGAQAMARALEAPMRQLVARGQLRAASSLVAEVKRRGAGWGYDALHDTVTDLAAARIRDSALTLRVALEVAASTAIMVLGTDALVLARRPHISLEP